MAGMFLYKFEYTYTNGAQYGLSQQGIWVFFRTPKP